MKIQVERDNWSGRKVRIWAPTEQRGWPSLEGASLPPMLLEGKKNKIGKDLS